MLGCFLLLEKLFVDGLLVIHLSVVFWVPYLLHFHTFVLTFKFPSL
jgi:hypothetical protein